MTLSNDFSTDRIDLKQQYLRYIAPLSKTRGHQNGYLSREKTAKAYLLQVFEKESLSLGF